MIDRKHNVIVDIDGEQVGFRFSTWALNQTIKQCGLKGVIELYEKLGALDIDVVSALTMQARKEYLFSIGKEQGVTLRESCELIDGMGGVIAAMQKFSEGVQGHTPKNQQPPQQVGEPETISQ